MFITTFSEILPHRLCYMIINYADESAENLDVEGWDRANTNPAFGSRLLVRYLWLGGGL